jgi:hypothetical protein
MREEQRAKVQEEIDDQRMREEQRARNSPWRDRERMRVEADQAREKASQEKIPIKEEELLRAAHTAGHGSGCEVETLSRSRRWMCYRCDRPGEGRCGVEGCGRHCCDNHYAYCEQCQITYCIDDFHMHWCVAGDAAEEQSQRQKAGDGRHEVFVGGLPRNCDETALARAFARFGRVKDCIVMKDNETGESRGFGFLKFETKEIIDKILAQNNRHKIGISKVDCRRSSRGAKRDWTVRQEHPIRNEGSKGVDRSFPTTRAHTFPVCPEEKRRKPVNGSETTTHPEPQ